MTLPKLINRIYVNGEFTSPHGRETLLLVDPVTELPTTTVVLADEVDAATAIAAATRAYAEHGRAPIAQRAEWLQRMHDAVAAREAELVDVMIAEYGGPRTFSTASTKRVVAAFATARQVMLELAFERAIGGARVAMEPLGVVGLITPWNASNGFIASKLAMAIAAGCTAVIKPSELSAAQTQLLAECLHAAQLPPGMFNIVTGRGDVVGEAITRSRDVAKISFTGSTAVGKAIARGAADTLKRVTLELGGKSPNILLDDADFATAIPLAVSLAYMNSGQACIAGTRLLVPRARLAEAHEHLVRAVADVRVGDPRREDTRIGPMVTRKQYERVESYLRLARDEGAELLVGGEGLPAGLERGYFVKPTVLTGVTNDMRIAREEIFGPVLVVIPHDGDDDAVRIANDSDYGLQAYVSSASPARAQAVAARLVAGRVFVNGLYDEPLAPFGGFKQSGLGREFGPFGLEAYLEPKSIVGPRA